MSTRDFIHWQNSTSHVAAAPEAKSAPAVCPLIINWRGVCQSYAKLFTPCLFVSGHSIIQFLPQTAHCFRCIAQGAKRNYGGLFIVAGCAVHFSSTLPSCCCGMPPPAAATAPAWLMMYLRPMPPRRPARVSATAAICSAEWRFGVPPAAVATWRGLPPVANTTQLLRPKPLAH